MKSTPKLTPDQPSVSRRNLLQFGAGLLGTGSLTAWLGTGALAQTVERRAIAAEPTRMAAQDMTPDAALAKLMEGNRRFVAQRQQNPRQDTVRVAEVAAGQAPFAALLSCADSRVVPEIAFDQGVGDLFIVRMAGNIASIESIASEEFGVGVLGAKVLMVLGHGACGAVAAAIEGGELPGVIGSLVFAIRPAVLASKAEPGDRLTNAIKANVRSQVQRLKDSAVLSAAVQAGTVKIVGGYYDLSTGEVSLIS